jgi:hypothetical protein
MRHPPSGRRSIGTRSGELIDALYKIEVLAKPNLTGKLRLGGRSRPTGPPGTESEPRLIPFPVPVTRLGARRLRAALRYLLASVVSHRPVPALFVCPNKYSNSAPRFDTLSIGSKCVATQGLRESLTKPLDWNESQEAPYFTDKPTWDCYADLMLWAAYNEQPQLSRPIHHVLVVLIFVLLTFLGWWFGRAAARGR